MTGKGLLDREADALADLFTDSGARGSWFVLRTHSRQEKAVSRHLNATGVSHYLPLIPRVTIHGGRKFQSELPLFPGYVFLCGRADDAYGLMTHKRICQILPVHDQQKLAHELHQIHLGLQAGVSIELYPFAVIGRRCRVRAGALRGVEGTLVERARHRRFVLQVDMLGQGASVEVDADLLEPVE